MGSKEVRPLTLYGHLSSKLNKCNTNRVPGWHIALKSPFKPVAQDHLDEIFGIRWFSWAVGEFFEREFGWDIEIDPKDKITVYPKATQFIQDDLTHETGFTDTVHSSPHSSMTRLSFERRGSRFDTVLIQKPEAQLEGGLYGIGSKYYSI
jgi:hypothetical protein